MKFEVVWKFEPRRVIVSTVEEAYLELGKIAGHHLLTRDEGLEVEPLPDTWTDATRVSLYREGGDVVLDCIAYIRLMFA